jgi:predicted amidohydrolase YtcJ
LKGKKMFANLIVLNGKIYSLDMHMNRQQGTAVAIADGSIIYVGSDNEVMQYSGENSIIIDAKGHTILPGLCDAHCHASFTASSIIACNLFNVFPGEDDGREDIINEFKTRIRKYMDDNPKATIVRGTGWNLGVFGGNGWQLPTRQELDDISLDKPIVLESFCQHNLWVNTKAIELAGITAATPTPAAGNIPREANGFPSGLFQEMASMALIRENIEGYDYTVEQYQDTIRYYQEHLANIYGVTLVGEMLFTQNAREAYKRLAENNELTIRVRGVYEVAHEDFEQKLAEVIERKGQDNVNELFEINTIKVFMEGEFAMCEPYENEIINALNLPADYTGSTFWPKADSDKLFTDAMKAGFQLHVHAMGDQAVKQTIGSLGVAQGIYGNEVRSTIAHLMAIKQEDIEAGGKLGIIASCQPRWMVCDTDIEVTAVPYFSKDRAYNFYPNKRLRNAGWIVAYGTDFPVTPPPNPFHEIQCGITRTLFPDAADYEPYKGLVLGPAENKMIDAVSLDESIQSLTINGAYQMFLEHITGSIEIAKSADLVVLDSDLEAVPVDKIYSISVDKTIFRGKVVYSAT